jgi:formate--tetrahydrofolate ligase
VTPVRSSIEIARDAKMKPIAEIGCKLDIPNSAIVQYGPHKTKITLDYIDSLKS